MQIKEAKAATTILNKRLPPCALPARASSCSRPWPFSIRSWPGRGGSPDEIAETRQWCAARLQDVACPTSVEPGLFAQANHDAVLKNAHGGQQ